MAETADRKRNHSEMSLGMDNAAAPGQDKQSSTSLAELNDRLDDLWIKYLDCLDRYQRAQESVQKALSSVRGANVFLYCCFSGC